MPRRVASTTAPNSPHATTAGAGKVGRLNLAGGSTVSYLWVLVGLELLVTLVLRSWSAGHHGG